MIRALIYGLDSSTHAACCIAPAGSAAMLALPAPLSPRIRDQLRGAHLFAPVEVLLAPPLVHDKERNCFVCADLTLP
jgi:hypothetical protein